MSDSDTTRSPTAMTALATAMFLIGFGMLGVGVYVAGAVKIFLDDSPDKSWLLWGLPVAAIGLTLAVGGVILLVMWRRAEGEPDAD